MKKTNQNIFILLSSLLIIASLLISSCTNKPDSTQNPEAQTPQPQQISYDEIKRLYPGSNGYAEGNCNIIHESFGLLKVVGNGQETYNVSTQSDAYLHVCDDIYGIYVDNTDDYLKAYVVLAKQAQSTSQ